MSDVRPSSRWVSGTITWDDLRIALAHQDSTLRLGACKILKTSVDHRTEALPEDLRARYEALLPVLEDIACCDPNPRCREVGRATLTEIRATLS